MTMTPLAYRLQMGESEALFRALSESEQFQAESRAGLGMIFLSHGTIEDATEAFHEALKSDPKNADALYGLGVIAERSAQSYFAGSLNSNPKHVGASRNSRPMSPHQPKLVDVQEEAGDSEEATTENNDSYARDLRAETKSTANFYSQLKADSSKLSRDSIRLIDSLEGNYRPRMSAFLGIMLAVGLLLLFVVLFAFELERVLTCGTALHPHPSIGTVSITFGVAVVGLLIAAYRLILLESNEYKFEGGVVDSQVRGFCASCVTGKPAAS